VEDADVEDSASRSDGVRSSFEASVQALRGRTVTAIDYWDIHNFAPEPARWDYGEWHHAVMGVQLVTDTGPVTVTWTNTFYPYGVEVFHDPIEEHLVQGEMGPARIGPDGRHAWSDLLPASVSSTATHWERLELGPARLADGTIVEPARSVEVPTALRLDFDARAVWFVAAIPQWPEMERVFIPGDEIVVVFSRQKMLDMGFDDQTFLLSDT
jgi:hypothetical protein